MGVLSDSENNFPWFVGGGSGDTVLTDLTASLGVCRGQAWALGTRVCAFPFPGVFITHGDVGVGTIVGSAVFNILCIIGVCGLFAGQVSGFSPLRSDIRGSSEPCP